MHPWTPGQTSYTREYETSGEAYYNVGTVGACENVIILDYVNPDNPMIAERTRLSSKQFHRSV